MGVDYSGWSLQEITEKMNAINSEIVKKDSALQRQYRLQQRLYERIRKLEDLFWTLHRTGVEKLKGQK